MLASAQQLWFFYIVYTADGRKLSFLKWFHVFMLLSSIFKQFFCAVRVDVKQGGGQISNIKSMYEARVYEVRVAQWVWIAPQKQKQFMDNLPKFCLSRNGAYPKFTVLVYFWLGQIYPLKAHKILLKVKTFQKTISSGISTNTISGPRIFCKLYATALYYNNR